MTNRTIAEVFPPGEFIKEELEARNWIQLELAEIIGRSPKVVNDLILGKRPISPELAKALGDAFGTSAQYWMNLESSYQLSHTEDPDGLISRRARLYEKAPIKDMVKRGWIEKSENIEVLEQRIVKHFGLNSIDDAITYPVAARKKGLEITPAQWAWFFRVKHLAYAAPARSYSLQALNKCLEQLKAIMPDVHAIRNVPKILAEAGIRFMVVEHLPQTKIDGVTLWLDNKYPVIALSMRYDRVDYFWFTLMHELGHVSNGDGKTGMALDIKLVDGDRTTDIEDIEQKANDFAMNFLVEQDALNDFVARVAPIYTKDKIVRFATLNKVHPGIVVGQLHSRGEINYDTYRKLLEKVKNIVIPSALTDGWGQTVPV